MPDELVFILTDPWMPDGEGGYEPLYSYGYVEDIQSCEVRIPGNAKRTARLSIKTSHRLAWLSEFPVSTYGWAFFNGECIFVGPMAAPDSDTETRDVEMSFVGVEAMAESHFVRLGDTVLNGPDYSGDYPTEANPFNRKIPPNGTGIRMLRDAARGSVDQELNYPPLGIRDGFDDTVVYDPLSLTPVQERLLIKRERGDQVFRAMQEVTQILGGPDMEIHPVWGVPGVYADLNTYARQGDYHATGDRVIKERTSTGGESWFYHVAFHGGGGVDNADVKFGSSGKVITHAHVLSANKKIRVTSTSGEADWFGIWVEWEEAEFNGHKNALKLKGDILVSTYKFPARAVEIRPKPNCNYTYLQDYMVGTAVKAHEYQGGISDQEVVRINEVVLSRPDATSPVETSLIAVTSLDFPGYTAFGEGEA